MTLARFAARAAVATGLALATLGGAHATTLRFASEAPRSDTQFLAAQRLNDLLKQRTGGQLELKVFPDGTLGNAQAAISGTRGSTIDVLVSGSANFSGLVPQIGMLDIPFVFADTKHAYKVLDGEVGDALLAQLETVGLKGLAFWDNGWRQMTNSKHPIKTPADVAGLKMRTTGAPVHIDAFKLLGANPVPMPLGELYTALEMKTVDAQEHPIGVFVSAKLYEVQRHLTMSYHAYSALVVAMNKAKFDALPADQQKALVAAAREAGAYQRQLNNDAISKQVQEMKDKGLAVVETMDQKPFVDATKGVREMFVSKFGGADLLQKIDAQR